MKKLLIITSALIISAFCLLNLQSLARADEKCTGRVYQDHPGLLTECLHQQLVNHTLVQDDPYPAPGDPGPYPAPETPAPTEVIYPTVVPANLPTPTCPPDGCAPRWP